MDADEYADMEEDVPVPAQLLGDKAYVWDVSGVKRLRRRHRMMGAMVGGVTEFKSQVAFAGLPLQLGRDEIALALSKGWVDLYVQPSPAGDRQQPPAGAPTAGGAQKRSQPEGGHPCQDPNDDYYGDYYASYGAGEAAPAAGQASGAAAPGPADDYDNYYAQAGQGGQPAAAAAPAMQQAGQPGTSGEGEGRQPGWHDAVRSGAHISLPTTAGEAAEMSAASATARQPAEPLLPPLTPDQARRALIFADLHARGFTITSGSKFGGQLMAYPGDPRLYHAQFVVRVMRWDEQVCPTLLKAYSRGVHAARKHLVLATVRPDALEAALAAAVGGWRLGRPPGGAVVYTTFARETGFVSTKVRPA